MNIEINTNQFAQANARHLTQIANYEDGSTFSPRENSSHWSTILATVPVI